MKDFVKYTLATVCGFVLICVIFFFVGIFSLASLIISDSKVAEIKPQSVLHLQLDGILNEYVKDDPIGELLGNAYPQTSLKETLSAIENAKNNPNINGIYIESFNLTDASPAMLREIRTALSEFKRDGKFIIAYSDHYTQGCYYICSEADKIILNPKGQIDWHGLASEPIFYKDLLKRLGIKMQVFKVGDYKSAVEPFTTDRMSEANREQVRSYLSCVWDTYLDDVSQSRLIDCKTLNHYADTFLSFRPAEDLVNMGMIDTLCYIDEVKRIIEKENNGNFTFVTPKELNISTPALNLTDDKIAVYYAYGDIIDRKSEWDENVIAADVVCKDLKKLREDTNIKAVVIRINSGGGSAFASEQIWREVKLLSQTKPVVVSMGGMAASGGYYIASAAPYIIAESTTLTGSIGIFGMIPDMTELLTQKLGLHFDIVKTNEHSDFGTISRPLNASESRALQRHIERGYQLFVQRVAEGRKMSTDQVLDIAEGRIWTGKQAVNNGLVDANGNLNTAIHKAAEMGGLQSYQTVSYPTPEPWYQDLLGQQKRGYINSAIKETLGSYYTPWMNLKYIQEMDQVQAHIPFELNITN